MQHQDSTSLLYSVAFGEKKGGRNKEIENETAFFLQKFTHCAAIYVPKSQTSPMMKPSAMSGAHTRFPLSILAAERERTGKRREGEGEKKRVDDKKGQENSLQTFRNLQHMLITATISAVIETSCMAIDACSYSCKDSISMSVQQPKEVQEEKNFHCAKSHSSRIASIVHYQLAFTVAQHYSHNDAP